MNIRGDAEDFDVTRRQFVQVGAAGLFGAAMAKADPPTPTKKAVIQLNLVGGPSQLDTWDPKPQAPESVRGPFPSIATAVPGMRISECFPRMAKIADRFTLVRSLTHDEAALHEIGGQLIQTGAPFRNGVERPHFAAVAAAVSGDAGVPAWAILPGPIGDTGMNLPNGQTAAGMPSHCQPVCLEEILANSRQNRVSQRDFASSPNGYPNNEFGTMCLLARRLVESGVRVVTVNMFRSVFGAPSWDMHANGRDLNATFDDYRYRIGPMFDGAYVALIADLSQRGLLDDVLVIAAGEFGRTPRINPRGGRDHWTGAWTAVLAGGGIQGGRIVGATDDRGAYPVERPVHPRELVASIYRCLEIAPESLTSVAGTDLARASAIDELF